MKKADLDTLYTGKVRNKSIKDVTSASELIRAVGDIEKPICSECEKNNVCPLYIKGGACAILSELLETEERELSTVAVNAPRLLMDLGNKFLLEPDGEKAIDYQTQYLLAVKYLLRLESETQVTPRNKLSGRVTKENQVDIDEERKARLERLGLKIDRTKTNKHRQVRVFRRD